MSTYDHLCYRVQHLLSQSWFKTKNYVRNIWLFRKALANTTNWDYHGLLLLMQTQLSSMEEGIRLHGYHLNKDNHCRRMRECAYLLKRIADDNYYKADYDWKEGGIVVTPLYDYPRNERVISDYTHKQKTRDLERLFYLLNKYIQHMWD